MSSRGRTFRVEVKRSRNPDYASKPGDARRSGRADRAAGMQAVQLSYFETAASIEARLGVIIVGAITHDVTSKGYFWAVYLPGFVPTPRPARDVEAAKRAIIHKVGEWCEAAKLISGRQS